jgi:hypothetical protein
MFLPYPAQHHRYPLRLLFGRAVCTVLGPARLVRRSPPLLAHALSPLRLAGVAGWVCLPEPRFLL